MVKLTDLHDKFLLGIGALFIVAALLAGKYLLAAAIFITYPAWLVFWEEYAAEKIVEKYRVKTEGDKVSK